jgi:hypothetical protein
MTRYTMPALLIILVAAGAATAADPELRDEAILREVRELREQVAALRRLREMDAKMNALDMRLLNERLDRIEKSLEKLATSRSEFTPRSTFKRSVDSGTGTIKLDNRLPVTAFVTIDGTLHTVDPFGVRFLRGQAAGSLTYTVGGAGRETGPRTRSSLAAGETLTLTIFDR